MPNFRFTILLATLGWAQCAQASDSSGSAALYGLGGMKCQAVIQDRNFLENTPSRSALREWFLGYLSASNVEKTGVFDLSPIQSSDDLYALLYNRCKTMPDAGVQRAAVGLINTLAISKSTQFTPMVEFRNDYGSIQIRGAVVTQIQAVLAKKGLFKGYVDGKPTPALQNAIKVFQTQQKMHETGLPDTDTVIRLVVLPATEEVKKASR